MYHALPAAVKNTAPWGQVPLLSPSSERTVVGEVTAESTEAAAGVEGAGEGIVAGVFAGLADGEAALGLLSGDAVRRGYGGSRGYHGFWYRVDGNRQRVRQVSHAPGASVGAGEVGGGEAEVGGDGGAEGAAGGAGAAGATVVA